MKLIYDRPTNQPTDRPTDRQGHREVLLLSSLLQNQLSPMHYPKSLPLCHYFPYPDTLSPQMLQIYVMSVLLLYIVAQEIFMLSQQFPPLLNTIVSESYCALYNAR